jgi:simple sugar transport system ATP-binding protein
MDTPFVELKGISKYFAKVVANNNVSFSIHKGEVLALLGENGAGKSTIMKILYGLYQAEEGEIFINGRKTNITSPRDAMGEKIGMIQQHFALVPPHTVTENIVMGSLHGILNNQDLRQRIIDLADHYGFDVDPDSYVKDLPVGLQQKVEILKALYQNVELLIMDEPTAVLTPQEADNLMQFVRQFVEKGNAAVFITHKMNEVMKVADRVVVMRNGAVLGDLEKNGTNEHELSSLMVGKEIFPLENRRRSHSGTGFEVDGLSVTDQRGHKALDNIGFTIGKGEILGIAGVSGNGQQELGDAIIGVLAADSGDIRIDGESICHLTVRERIKKGIGYVHADRHAVGLVLDMSLGENMFLKSSFDRVAAKGIVIDRNRFNDYADKAISDYSIKTSGREEQVKGLSGGNQQKVVVAREVDIGRKLIIFDQPTRGLDLGAIDYVHKTILAERDKGKSILLISTELSEIFALSDRIAVIYNGKLLKTMDRKDAAIEEVGLLMAGITEEEHHEP